MRPAHALTVNLEGFKRLVFTYDDEDDIAYIHVDGARPAVTERVDDGWYLRLDGDAIAGMELHGLKRIFLSTPFYSSVFQPAILELEDYTGGSFDEGGVSAEGQIGKLPRTSHLLIFMIGQAMVKYETARRLEFEDAGRELLTAS